jgi:hypothetical protein
MKSRRLDWRDDCGQLAGIEVLPFGLLIFVCGTLLVTSAWAMVDAKFATDAAAREAVRAFVEFPGGDFTAATAAADDAARAALVAHGRDPNRADIELVSLRTSRDGSVAYARCARVVYEVRYRLHAISIPLIGGYGSGLTATSRHSEIVDPFRSGIPGEVAC